jgi:hypothetical protein
LNLTEKIADRFFIQNIKDYKKQLLLIHENAKEDICKILENQDESSKIFQKEFINVFNAISIKKRTR